MGAKWEEGQELIRLVEEERVSPQDCLLFITEAKLSGRKSGAWDVKKELYIETDFLTPFSAQQNVNNLYKKG